MTGREKNKISEDLEFSMRVKEITGKHIVFNPEVKVQHRVPMTDSVGNILFNGHTGLGV